MQLHTSLRSTLLSGLALGLASQIALADTINLTDGSNISDVRVVKEGLSKVEYKDGNKTETVDSDRVLSIEFDRKPDLIDKAEQDVLDELLAGAVDYLNDYVAGVEGKEQKREPWAPAYAMYRLVELHETMGAADKVAAAVDKLLQNEPDSRYVPMALLKKAEALYDAGKGDSAIGTVKELQQLVDSKGLSDLWKLECKVREVQFDDSLKSSARRDKLETLVGEAEDYPTVRNRALVALGQSWLDSKKVEEASDIFKVVVDDPNADSRTLAAAYMGMGDCLFQQGANSLDQTVLNDALINYMRVVVVYKSELRYVPRAMFQAGRVFQHLEGEESEERAQRLYLRLMRDFRGTRWADEARGFRK